MRKFKMAILVSTCTVAGFIAGNSTNDVRVVSAAVPPPTPTTVNICVEIKTGALRLPPNGKHILDYCNRYPIGISKYFLEFPD